MVVYFVVWCANCLIGVLVGCFVDGLADCSHDCLSDWLIGSLVVWLIMCCNVTLLWSVAWLFD